MLMKWGLNLGWAPVMQIKKGTQNLRSWVHTMLSHPWAWVPNVQQWMKHCRSFNVSTRLASLSWADQQGRLTGDAKPGGTAVPSLKAVTFTGPLWHRMHSMSRSPFGWCHTVTQWLNKCFCHQFSKMPSPKNESHQLPTPKPCPFPNQHLPNPLRYLSSWASLQSQFIKHHLVFYASSKSPWLWCISWHPRVRLAEPKPGTAHKLAKSPGSASLHRYMFVLNYSWKGILIPPRQLWKEIRSQLIQIQDKNLSCEFRGASYKGYEVLQLAEEKEQNHPCEWLLTLRLLFTYQLILNRKSW